MKWPGIDMVLRAFDIAKKTDIDAVEERIQGTVSSNHSAFIRELQAHDQNQREEFRAQDERIRQYNKENRDWMEARFDRFIDQIMLNRGSK